jgi:trans-aconitate methyltransferase
MPMTMSCSVREWLKHHFPVLHSAWRFTLASVEFVRDPWARGATFDRCFDQQPDPWGFSQPREQERLQSALRMLEGVGGRFERAFEIGCAEGMFTRHLQQHCASLLAVDVSTVALQRAQQLGHEGVKFLIWDLRHDAVPGDFDLVVAMCVLEYLRRPRDFRAARARLVTATRPGGYLLVGHARQSPMTENSRWGRWFLRDGKWINEFLERCPALEPVATAAGDHYINCLFRRRHASQRA